MRLSQSQLLDLLGEVTAISLESEPTAHESFCDVVVYIELCGKRFELMRAIRTGASMISLTTTRAGIAAALMESWGKD